VDAEERGTTTRPEPTHPSAHSEPAATRSRDALSESVQAVTEPIGRSAAVGTLWLTAQKWVVRLSGFLTIAILTRLISPAEFGVVAAAAAVIPIVLLLADLGLSTYIVQAEHLPSRTVSTGFWFSLTAGIVLAGVMALAAPLLAIAFNVGDSADVLRGMSLAALATVLASLPTALLRRRLRFKLLAIQATVATVIAQVVAIALALLSAGAWALVAQLAVSQALIGLLAWRSSHWRPTGEFSVSEFRTMARFGAKVMAVEGAAAARVAGEAAIISNALGPAALGYVSIAQRLVQTAQDIGASALAPVSTVIFAKVRHDPERLRAGYRRALRIGYTAVAPVMVMVAVGAPYIVPLVFGSDWAPSIPVTQGLAVAAILVLGAMIDHGPALRSWRTWSLAVLRGWRSTR
jgi:O-antigen/teichoic acid export membrane protein